MATKPTGPSGATIYSVADRAGVSIATVSRVLQGSPLVSERTRSQGAGRRRRAQLRPPRRRAQPRRPPARGPRPGAARARPVPTTPSCSWASSPAPPTLGQSVVLMLADDKPDLARGGPQARHPRRRHRACSARPPSPTRPCGRCRARKPVVLIAGDAAYAASTPSPRRTPTAPDEITAHVLRPRPHARSSSSVTPTSAPTSASRYAGFVAAHAERGLTARRAGAHRVARGGRHGIRPDRCSPARSPPTPSSAPTTSWPSPSCSALQDGGRRVPEDVAVVGWDDVMTARYVVPGLTTVRQPVARAGRPGRRPPAPPGHRRRRRRRGADRPDPAGPPASCGCPPAAARSP